MRPESFHRETFVALRARRQAYRIAREVLHPPLDPSQYFCRHCGALLDGERLDVRDHIRCDVCGLRSHLPPAVAAAVRMRRAARPKDRPPTRFDLGEAAMWGYLILAMVLLLTAL